MSLLIAIIRYSKNILSFSFVEFAYLHKIVNMFSTDLVTLFLTFVQISAIPSNVQKNDDFSFPLEKSDDSCTFKNGTVGRCVNASQCPNAHSDHRSGINPTICHFEHQESVICCLMETSLAPRPNLIRLNTTDRKSVAYCKDVYSLPIPIPEVAGSEFDTDRAIVGGEVTVIGEFPHMVGT